MVHYKKLDEWIWQQFGKELLDKDDQERRLEFLRACIGGKKSFLQYLKDHLFNRDGCVVDGETIDLDYKFDTEENFLSPSENAQKIIWETFKDISDEEKMKSGFWGFVVIQLIESDLIEPYYLARTKDNLGLYNLYIAINSNDKEEIDFCIRRILNSMGNRWTRGSRVLYDNFGLGRAYWNYHWANQMEEVIGLSANEILKVLKGIGDYSIFAAKMSSWKSYISHENILGGLLLFLKDNQLKSGQLGKIIDKLSYISAWKAIEAQSPEQNCKEVAQIINN